MKWSPILCLIYLGLCLAKHPDSILDEEKCDKLGGAGTYERLKVAREKSRICVDEFLGKATFKGENEARTTGISDKVIPKYGNSIRDVNVCLKDYVEIAKFCLTKEERKSFITIVEALRKGVDHVYENDGQELIEFIEKNGIECITSHIGGIMKCYRDNPLCKDFETFTSCTIQELKNCPIISTDISGELLRHVKNAVCTDNKIIRSRRSLRRIVRDANGVGQHLPHIERAVKNVCVRDGGVTEEKLNATLREMGKCVKEKPIFLTPKQEYLDHLDSCSKEAVKEFTACLPEKLKYLPKFIFQLAHSLVRLLYDDFDEVALGLGPCVDKLNTKKSSSDYHACLNRAGADDDDEIPTSKEEFCKTFIPMTKCFTKQINATCEPSEYITKFSKDYITAMEEPCKLP